MKRILFFLIVSLISCESYAAVTSGDDATTRPDRYYSTNAEGLDSLASAMEELAQESDWEDDQPSESIRRTKRVELMMMTDDEAIVQMEMLGHSFFVYLDEDGFTKVLYRRKNGYGVLICR